VGGVDEVGGGTFDLAVNATSLGLREGDPLPLDPPALPPVDAALDLVYTRGGETAWVRAMRGRGVPAGDGREMLLMQGAAAFRRWWGVEAPLEAMRAALDS
jgi:shikimate dehydrogenase